MRSSSSDIHEQKKKEHPSKSLLQQLLVLFGTSASHCSFQPFHRHRRTEHQNKERKKKRRALVRSQPLRLTETLENSWAAFTAAQQNEMQLSDPQPTATPSNFKLPGLDVWKTNNSMLGVGPPPLPPSDYIRIPCRQPLRRSERFVLPACLIWIRCSVHRPSCLDSATLI